MNPNDPLETHFRLTAGQKAALKKLGLKTIRDLLYHLPFRYGEEMRDTMIHELAEGARVSVVGRISGLETSKGFRTKTPMARGVLEDGTGKLNVVWFHQPYMAKMLRTGSIVRLTGTIAKNSKGFYIANPESEPAQEIPAVNSLLDKKDKEARAKEQNILQPAYPESRGITSRWFFYNLQRIFSEGVHEKMEDPLPEAVRKRYNLPSLQASLVWIHQPRKPADAEAARKRFAFEEIFFIQLARQRARQEYQSNPGFAVEVDAAALEKFTECFGFPLTGAQEKAIAHILEDFKTGVPMTRLLEGDVGSGKTAVAAACARSIATANPAGQDFGNLQVAIMAPTEILATQHFETFTEHFAHLPIQVGLLTSGVCKKFPSKIDPSGAVHINRPQLLRWVASGEIPILIGTHSLIQEKVKFKHLAFVVIDEQHRFGTMQRARLAQKEMRAPHLLSMTATPIPRTLALTMYGDLDLTLLDELPPGRKPVETKIVPPAEREAAYQKIREELAVGRQAYVICPRIDEPDPTKLLALNAKSVKEESKRLKKEIFPDKEIEILHSKMKKDEREDIMARFAAGDIDILVATSVIEVGVNIPNATVIVIEGAERFGLAQLHQLRGRVLRSNHQAHCFIFTESKSAQTKKRLKALTTAKNGFELAEHDLAARGAGALAGGKQWGITDIGMEAIKNMRMVEAARREAAQIIESDPALKHHPSLASRMSQYNNSIHLG